jgi:serine protease Do
VKTKERSPLTPRGNVVKLVAYSLALLLFLSTINMGYAEEAPLQATLNDEIMGLIRNSVFEVVAPKPSHDSLIYERPLPVELLPYSIRNDKYYSIGTAFAIGPDQFVSAAHVMNLGIVESQLKDVFLRDGEGKVYEIAQILKYSDHRDFVVFSLKDKTAEHYLPLNRNPKLDARVYAVGNALGQGIIIRDGLYTSNTPEDFEGEWQWMRFSAAVSPGNSGGPLLDERGRVLGIVLGKSENENLNYALPIAEVFGAKESVAVSYKKVKYVLENMENMSKLATFRKEIELPKNHRELNDQLVRDFTEFTKQLLNDFLAENRADIFPNGDGSSLLLHKVYNTVFPNLIMRDSDGSWDSFHPSDTYTSELGNNGYLSFGQMADSLFLYIQTPDDVPLEEFYTDSKLFMDLILKGVPYYRDVASEKVRAISFGKAQERRLFVDSYGRKWIVQTWLTEYDDQKIAAFSLPVPGGCVTILKQGQTGQVNSGYIPDLEVLADFINVSYYGTFGQWREFFKMTELLPETFSTMDMKYDSETLRFTSERLSFSHTPEMMGISDDSDLELLFSYFKDGDKTVWDVRGIVVGEDKNNSTYFGIYRENRPLASLRDTYKSEWDSIVHQRFPYDGSVFIKDGNTIIMTVYDEDKTSGNSADPKVPYLYTVAYQAEGTFEQSDMDTRLQIIVKNIHIHDGAKHYALHSETN